MATVEGHPVTPQNQVLVIAGRLRDILASTFREVRFADVRATLSLSCDNSDLIFFCSCTEKTMGRDGGSDGICKTNRFGRGNSPDVNSKAIVLLLIILGV